MAPKRHTDRSGKSRDKTAVRQPKSSTHVAQREDTTAPLLLGQAIVKGFFVMLPPQARPTQPVARGELISIRVSKGAASASGIATRKVNCAVVYSAKQTSLPVVVSQNLVLACRRSRSEPWWPRTWPARRQDEMKLIRLDLMISSRTEPSRESLGHGDRVERKLCLLD